ncbi:DMT family transporter [Microvirga rosea]|uniref:DMT family transporter n=1 Tax=Microvirga rosea TaxID=2715425 RepID=UPI001D0AE982|nr:DMT family transporter [Microvirga rosea]MCB8823431.1 DMT family transporter [Microvirga rosea]
MTSKAADQGGDRSRYLVGALFGLAAVSIWAGWMPITRLSVTTSLTPYDLAMLRFGTAGLLLLPVLIRRGLALDRLRWWELLVMVVGAGAPYSLVAASGLRFAPAADAGVLTPGVMPLVVAVLASVVLRERIILRRKVGYGLILLGVIVIAGLAALLPGLQRSVGHLLFLSAAFMWACYTIILRKAALAPLHAAAIVGVGSAAGFTPIYLATQGMHFTHAPVKEIAFQMMFQGIVATILSLYLFGKAVSILGASAGAAFGALVPAMAALLAIPILGEAPSPGDWGGILAVSLGVYLSSGGPLWRRTRMVLPVDATEGT